MKIKPVLLLALSAVFSYQILFAQTGYNRDLWLQKADQFKPELKVFKKTPVDIIEVLPSLGSFHGYQTRHLDDIENLKNYELGAGDKVVLDFGEHLVGRLRFQVTTNGPAADAPARVKFKFGEIPNEIIEEYDPYPGALSRAWLQDEVINIDTLPSLVKMPRRYAFRYVQLEVIATSLEFKLQIPEIYVDQVSAVDMADVPPLKNNDPFIKRIDHISNKTLQDCMQTVYEDGPKRDRRLWIGDLRLQALTNYYTFNDENLVKRSLYLLAGLANEDGMVPGTIFEAPNYHAQENFPLDYALLFNSTIYDYAQATNDLSVAEDLWPVIKKQVELALQYVVNGIYTEPEKHYYWLFIDWNKRLDHQAPMQGIMIYTFQHTWEIAKMLNKENEIAFLPDRIKEMKAAAKKNFFDQEKGVFVSGYSRQVSLASQAWMILAEVVTAREGATILRKTEVMTNVHQPKAPYLYHYVAEAMIKSNLKKEAKDLVLSYWGGMVRNGADTFWEVYDPNDPDLSPYNSVLVNSYCHAWSCTPSYFIRKYPEIFK
ncbi:MAG: glycoside hydrolase [Bacteroidota bacterium]